MLIASMVVMIVLGSLVALGIAGYLIDKNADAERD